ncbi:hypothetical protein [Acrocarpospora sp. B8E8]|uniref:hypothetical protein n=1 Tax=Acrocarpospora sp. B8E8 TaxID=3153572 RepID=UPI00325F5401
MPRIVSPYATAHGTDAEILTWLDDHSRYALHLTAWPRVTGPIVRDTFRQAVTTHGVPASAAHTPKFEFERLTTATSQQSSVLLGTKGSVAALHVEWRDINFWTCPHSMIQMN